MTASSPQPPHSSVLKELGDTLDFSWKILRVIFGYGAALMLAVMALSAAQSRGWVVDPFQTPYDLSQQGLTGDVVASQVLDNLADMQSKTSTIRAPDSYRVNPATELKVEIPEVGVSLGEVNRYFRKWLGHDTHITGEIIHRDKKLIATVRVAGGSRTVLIADENTEDALAVKIAEFVYEQTQPYRYGVYLRQQGRHAESAGVMSVLANQGPSAVERSWGFLGWSNASEYLGDQPKALSEVAAAAALDRNNALANRDYGNAELLLGHDQTAYAQYRRLLTALKNGGEVGGQFLPRMQLRAETGANTFLGNCQPDRLRFGEEDAIAGKGERIDDFITHAFVLACAHRAKEALDLLAANAKFPVTAADLKQVPGATAPPAVNKYTQIFQSIFYLRAKIAAQTEMQDWAAIVELEPQARVLQSVRPDLAPQIDRTLTPWFSLARAMLGRPDARAAEPLADCYICLRAAARSAAARGDMQKANPLFAAAVEQAPSLPFSYSDWGTALLHSGDYGGAIAKFEQAQRIGPHFADPLEGWGEALMLQNRSDLALAKFAEAARYAPNWGRLRLKWGEALTYAGRRDEAKKQFALAATLDLSDADKAELAKVQQRAR